MSSSLADRMRFDVAVTNYEEAAARWYFVYDPGAPRFQPPENLEELYQLVAALSFSGHIGRALNVTYKFPQLFLGEMGGDVQRVLGIGQLLRGNVDEAVRRLEAAVSTHEDSNSADKLALDQVALARVRLVQGDLEEAFNHVDDAAQIAESLDRTLLAPVTRHTDYWHVLVGPVATGTVDLERAERVSEADKALHRRKVAAQLLRDRNPQVVAWNAVRKEHALPTRGIIFRRTPAENDNPWGWFLSFK